MDKKKINSAFIWRVRSLLNGSSSEIALKCILTENMYRYGLIMGTVVIEFLLYLIGIAVAVKLTLKTNSPGTQYAIIKYNYLAMAIILASFGKGFVFLMMIWDYYHPVFSNFSTVINIFVITSNVLAISGILCIHSLLTQPQYF